VRRLVPASRSRTRRFGSRPRPRVRTRSCGALPARRGSRSRCRPTSARVSPCSRRSCGSR